VVDFKDWQLPLGRRFRSLKLWMVMRLYGAEGIRTYLRNHIQLAKEFEELVRADERYEVRRPPAAQKGSQFAPNQLPTGSQFAPI
jgi:aromatic-L-amino-acid decarboxylase